MSKYKKATEPDGIPSKFLKHAGYEIAPITSGLINKFIEQGCFPSVLKKASVVPIYKKADKLEKGNYRPISLLLILAKNFEKVLAHQFFPFLNNVLSAHLSAFRRGYGCQDALLGLLEHWRKDLLAKKKIGAFLMDLSKAFDCMPHELLVSKLEIYGVQPKSSKIFILSFQQTTVCLCRRKVEYMANHQQRSPTRICFRSYAFQCYCERSILFCQNCPAYKLSR